MITMWDVGNLKWNDPFKINFNVTRRDNRRLKQNINIINKMVKKIKLKQGTASCF